MKAQIFLKALNVILENPQWRRKLKTIAIVGIIGLLLTGGLVIWAGFSAAKYVAQELGQHMGPAIAATTQATTEATTRAVESAETSLSQGAVLQGVASGVGVVASAERCLSNVQGLMESENLVAESLSSGISGIIMSLKNACLGAGKPTLPKSQSTSEEVI
ncbi:MAG: hypothetical protein U1E10_09050 [Bdellovibrionales bacterium]|nr:hypothetical protein [Bdellovibrionales bacterium]